jgi:hypothetical protein
MLEIGAVQFFHDPLVVGTADCPSSGILGQIAA